VWLGVSVEDQKRADERIPHLLQCPAAVRFLSCEPLLEAVDLRVVGNDGQLAYDVLAGMWRAVDGTPFDGGYLPRMASKGAIQWVICGGESGPRARPFYLGWAASMLEQCQGANVPFFMKQVGASPVVRGPSPGTTARPVGFNDNHGGDPAEWPECLRIREWPMPHASVAA
jgi:protein gp37